MCPVLHWHMSDHQTRLWEVASGQKQGQYYLGQPMKPSHVILGLSLSLPPHVAFITGCHDKTEDIKACSESCGRSPCPWMAVWTPAPFEFNLPSATSSRNKYNVVKSLRFLS